MLDSTGIEYTCPLINEIIDLLKQSYHENTLIDFNALNNAEQTLESIREANLNLRTIAKDALQKVDNLESELNLYIDKFEKAEELICELEDCIEINNQTIEEITDIVETFNSEGEKYG